MSTFDTWRAFSRFEREVSRNRRYIRSEQADRFLDGVRSTCSSRESHLSKGRGFWRAQLGHAWRSIDDIDDEIPSAYSPDRMKPLSDRALEGRANPKGIPVLYLCSNKEAAMSEVRPWLGSMISLAQFETTKPLKVVDCTRSSEQRTLIYFDEPSDDEIDSAVWSEIDRAFTKPVTRSDDSSEYVATQILTELFQDAGFDGIAFRSAFGERSINLALFDLESAVVTYGQLFEVTSAKLNFQERDNPYWVRSAHRSKSRKSKTHRKRLPPDGRPDLEGSRTSIVDPKRAFRLHVFRVGADLLVSLIVATSPVKADIRRPLV